MKVVHRFTANWRRLHVSVRVVRRSRERKLANLLSLALKTFGSYVEQNVT